jgi:transposase
MAFAAAITAQLPPARIVYDPFHVVSYANAAVDAVRRAEHRHRRQTGNKTFKERLQLWLYGSEGLDSTRRH